MRIPFLFIAASLIGAPVVAGLNDQGIIRTSGQVTATCSVDDLDIQLNSDGSNLKGEGFLNVKQSSDTEWTLKKTSLVEGRDFSASVEVKGYKNMQLSSTDTSKEDKKLVIIDGGHVPESPNELIRETLAWFDRYLGKVGE